MSKKKRGILVVSFGTSYVETRKKTIEQIETDIQSQYPECPVYRAWTSGMIRRKLLARDGLRVMDVREAMEQMASDGIREVVVQPTHVINGIENDRMTEAILSYRDKFEGIVVGTPLLTSHDDNVKVIQALAELFHPSQEEALVLMGHGTEHYANSIYAALNYQFRDMGYRNIFMGTVEAYPDFESLQRQVEELHPKRIILTPFMIVAGDHASNDLSGEDADSWKNRFQASGYEVRCVLKGLGEYPQLRQILLDHVADSMRSLEENPKE